VHRLVHRRVRVDGDVDLLAGRLQATGERQLGDELGRLITKDVRSQDLTSRQAADDLHHALVVPRSDGLAVRLQAVRADGVVLVLLEALLLQRPLGVPDAGDLRMAVRAAGDDRVVDRDRVVPRDALDAHDRLFTGDMREPRRADDVADRVDAGHARRVVSAFGSCGLGS
jgi:hypothetical protein